MKKNSSERILEWSEKIKKQMLSGDSAPKWCRENGVSYQSFLSWRKRLQEKPSVSREPVTRSFFLEVPEDSPEAWMKISFRGVRLTLFKDFDREALDSFLTLLRGL